MASMLSYHYIKRIVFVNIKCLEKIKEIKYVNTVYRIYCLVD